VHEGGASRGTPAAETHDVGRMRAVNIAGTQALVDAAAGRIGRWARENGRLTSVAILRPSNVFGPGMLNQSILQMIQTIERGIFFFIGRRGASANYVHVSNVVDALILCGRSAADGRTYNISDWCTMEDFVGAIGSPGAK
jgi:nucleoside-diphosphate-sugar epimerase